MSEQNIVGPEKYRDYDPRNHRKFLVNPVELDRYVVAGTLRFTGADIVTNAANITLSGTSSAIVDQNNSNALALFTTNASAGKFTLSGSQNLLTSAGSFTNAGSTPVALSP